MPPSSAAHWVEDEQGQRRPWTDLDAMMWRLFWAAGVTANAVAGGKDKNIFENMPQFPWSRPANQQSYGSFGSHTPEEVADYLDSL